LRLKIRSAFEKSFLSGALCLLLLLPLLGCSSLRSLLPTASVEAASPTLAGAGGLAETLPAGTLTRPTVPATASPTTDETSSVLTLWLPPQFDPDAGTPAGGLLKARLQAFVDDHPGLQLDVRLKALEGPGGMLDALVTAGAAAPQALPDLAALPRPILEKAALKGLVYSFDGLTTILSQSDWYGYARDLARLQQSTFGVPFAGDALVFLYQPIEGKEPPRTWGRLLEYPGTWGFAAADPEALFTLGGYQGLGGTVQDVQGRPALDGEILSDVLTFYINALQAGQVSDRLAQFETQDQVWKAYQEGQFPMAVTWATNVLPTQKGSLLPLPTQSGTAYTLATGWCWALASPQSEKRALGAELAEFLVEEDFLAGWSEAAGFLPPRAGALDGWQSAARRDLAVELSETAHLVPSSDILSSLGPALQRAVLQVLRQELTASEAAQIAAQSLGNP
jgi:multiple sugar transport system substrate-binding protein